MIKIIKQLLKHLFLIPIYVYQCLVSPLLPGACNFQPTCSEYSKLAIKQYGVIFGLYLSMKRVIRCNPARGWEFDPVPKHLPKAVRELGRRQWMSARSVPFVRDEAQIPEAQCPQFLKSEEYKKRKLKKYDR